MAYYVTKAGDEESSKTSQLAMAGVWESWKDELGKEVKSFAIVTVPPCNELKWLHDRMPAILQDEDEISEWLDELKSYPQVKHLLRTFKEGGLKWWPVSSEKLIDLKYQGEDCVAEIDLRKGCPPITSFFSKKEKSVVAAPSSCNSPGGGGGVEASTSPTKKTAATASKPLSAYFVKKEVSRPVAKVSAVSTNNDDETSSPKRSKYEDVIELE